MLEITRINNEIKKSSNLLSNSAFLEKASKEKIELEKRKLRDFTELLEFTTAKVEANIKSILTEPFITYYIQEIRCNTYKGTFFDKTYFQTIYSSEITLEEIENLYNVYKNRTLLDIFKQ